MQSRIKNPAMLFPDAMQAALALSSAVEKSGLSATIRGLVHQRVSQINGCSVCVDMGWRKLREGGETDERLFAVSAWRDAPYFTDAERAVFFGWRPPLLWAWLKRRPESPTGPIRCRMRCGMRPQDTLLNATWPP
jgi:AhpD family alkylhydroperoxidase